MMKRATSKEALNPIDVDPNDMWKHESEIWRNDNRTDPFPEQ